MNALDAETLLDQVDLEHVSKAAHRDYLAIGRTTAALKVTRRQATAGSLGVECKAERLHHCGRRPRPTTCSRATNPLDRG